GLEIRRRERAVRVRGEELGRDAAVVREHHEQALRRTRRRQPLRLGLTLRHGAEERRSDDGSTQTTEGDSAVDVLGHFRLSSVFTEFWRLAKGRNPPG